MKEAEETVRRPRRAPGATGDAPPREETRAGPPAAAAGAASAPAWERVKFRLRGLDWALIKTTLAVKFLIIALGGITFKIWENKPFDSWLGWLYVWNNWDAQSYQSIAQHGYQSGEGRFNLVFFPLYPLLVRLVASVARDYVLSAFVVSGVASVCAVLLLKRLALADEPERVARRASWFLLVFPTSYFLHIGYAESLFLALVLGCFVAARRGDWPLAGVTGLLAALCRVNGLLLFPVLLAEALDEYRRTGRRRWAWLWASPRSARSPTPRRSPPSW